MASSEVGKTSGFIFLLKSSGLLAKSVVVSSSGKMAAIILGLHLCKKRNQRKRNHPIMSLSHKEGSKISKKLFLMSLLPGLDPENLLSSQRILYPSWFKPRSSRA